MVIVSAAIEIAASPKTVWRVLADLAGYPDWNPFIRHARGSLDIGGAMHVRVQTRFRVPLAFRADVVERDDLRLRWRGKFVRPFLGTGDHEFHIEPVGKHHVRFVQRERFTGLLPLLAGALVAREVEHGFAAMNRALAERAERIERLEQRVAHA